MKDYHLRSDGLVAAANIAATGTTTMIAAPAAGLSLLVRHISYHAATTTTGRMTFSFLPSAGSNSFTRSVLTSGDTGEINIEDGWLLGAATGLYAAMSGASVPTINVSVVYDVVDRAR